MLPNDSLRSLSYKNYSENSFKMKLKQNEKSFIRIFEPSIC